MGRDEGRSSRQNVLVLSTSFPSYAGDPSGHFVESEATRLADEGHRVTVVCAGDGPAREPRGALTVCWAGGGRLFGWPGAQARLRAAPWRIVALAELGLGMRRQLERIGSVDRVVAHWIVPSAWPLARGVDAPVEAVAHGADVRMLVAMPARVRERILNDLVTRRATFRFVAESLRQQLLTSCSRPVRDAVAARSRVEACAIDVGVGHATRERRRRELGVGPTDVLVVVAARLVASKRIDRAIDVVAAMPPTTRLVVVGDGPARDQLERRARQLGVNARFVGFVPRPKALSWIASADVLLATSEQEAAPTVVREARALGVPVVSTPSGDVERWARDDGGIHCCEPHALTATLARVCAAPAAAERGILHP